ncbi:MAG: hypothetical protein QNJ84_17765 [Alphaproteobacteria bacterium]|nr:hypothetical protein [Alphaproteobacteria bacterium]
MATFDFSRIENEQVRAVFERMLKVNTVAGAAVQKAYGKAKKPVSTIFVDDPVFNASASLGQSRYLIKISASVPLLTAMLFGRFFAQSAVMPWLTPSDEAVGARNDTVQFITDPKDFGDRDVWRVSLTNERLIASAKFADMCLAFIALHELGHVVAGHAEGTRHYYGRAEFSELFAVGSRPTDQRERDQSWEYDADAVAVVLLMDYLDDLAKQKSGLTKHEILFDKDKDLFTQLLSFMVIALFVLFNYIRGARYDLELATSHPHPMVRIQYIKDMMVHEARKRTEFDLLLFLDLIDQRLEEAMIGLEE